MIGQVFGQLTVLSRAENKGVHLYWNCRCSCGRESCVRSQNLKAGKSKSCGCLHKKIAKERFSGVVGYYNRMRKLPEMEGQIREIVRRYKESARKRTRDFSLTNDEVRSLVLAPCTYCGIAPTSFQKVRKTPTQGLSYNGIDRVDNMLGYVPGNVVTCCAQCNYAKRAQTPEEFLNWARRISDYQKNNNKS